MPAEGIKEGVVEEGFIANGWELTLRFSDVQVSLAKPVYPPPGAFYAPDSASVPSRSA